MTWWTALTLNPGGPDTLLCNHTLAFQTSLVEGDGAHSMMVSKELQAGAKARAGDLVSITLEPDTAERSIFPPQELESALVENQRAASVFENIDLLTEERIRRLGLDSEAGRHQGKPGGQSCGDARCGKEAAALDSGSELARAER
jgi:hypothetical protein